MSKPLLYGIVGLQLFLASHGLAQTVFKDAPLDPAEAPVSVESLQPVLDLDLKEALTSGGLAPSIGRGVVVGIVQRGVRRVIAYGPVHTDSVFEIGSITKTFTGLILAQMVLEGKVHLDDPVRTLLPHGTLLKPAGPEITLLDLTVQHSGLPRNPDNLHPANPENPFADYGSKDLYAYLRKRGVAHSPGTPYAYSNTGVKLLANALSVRAALPYPKLLQQEITLLLGMEETGIDFTPSMKHRFVQGLEDKRKPAEAYTFSDLPGAGGIHSTANDMLTYLNAQLHPDDLKLLNPASTLPAAIKMTHQIRDTADPGLHIAMNWFHSDTDGNYQHGGRTGGFTAYAIFNTDRDFGIIVLCNTSFDRDSFAERLAEHVAQRLVGSPAFSLAKEEN